MTLDKSGSPAPAANDGNGPPPRPKVLVVEDDEVTQRLFKRFLERNGYDVSTADNGFDAFDIALREQPRLVLLDLMMPKLDGFGFLRLLRNSPVPDLPVIVTSALADVERKNQAVALGVKEYMVKSKFTLNELIDAVKRYTA
jgi:CheY-like chemotaxis protein